MSSWNPLETLYWVGFVTLVDVDQRRYPAMR